MGENTGMEKGLDVTVNVKLECTIIEICDSHPTCEGCCFRKEHKGCYFRNKTPREWDEIRKVEGYRK